MLSGSKAPIGRQAGYHPPKHCFQASCSPRSFKTSDAPPCPAQPSLDLWQQAWNRVVTAVVAGSLLLTSAPQPAQAVLNSPNAQIARTAEAALRRSIPAFNPEIKEIQANLEEIAYLLRIPQRKPFGTMSQNLQASIQKFNNKDRLMEGVPASNLAQASEALEVLNTSLRRLEVAIASQQPDYIGLRVAEALKATADLELLQAPGLAFVLPKDYQAMPRLVGRAVVQLEVERGSGQAEFVDQIKGGTSKTGTIQITLDGYSAPLSAGNFLVNVMNGKYDGRKLEASGAAVVAPSPVPVQAAPIPLEILPLGEFDPLYRLPLDVQSGELPVLPLSINGAVSMTHVSGSESFLNGDEWFMYKFDKQQAGLAGLAFDEGTFGVFGYVTQGIDVMTKLKSGDVIVKASVVSGADKLTVPGGSVASLPAPPAAAAASS